MHFVFTRAKLEAKERAEKKRLLEEEEERCIKILIKFCDDTVRQYHQEFDSRWNVMKPVNPQSYKSSNKL